MRSGRRHSLQTKPDSCAKPQGESWRGHLRAHNSNMPLPPHAPGRNKPVTSDRFAYHSADRNLGGTSCKGPVRCGPPCDVARRAIAAPRWQATNPAWRRLPAVLCPPMVILNYRACSSPQTAAHATVAFVYLSWRYRSFWSSTVSFTSDVSCIVDSSKHDAGHTSARCGPPSGGLRRLLAAPAVLGRLLGSCTAHMPAWIPCISASDSLCCFLTPSPLIQRRAPPQPRHHPMRGLPWWPKVSWLGAAPPVAPWQSPTPPMSSGPAWSCRESWHAAGRWFTAERCTVGGSCMLANGNGLGCSPAEGSRARLWLAGAGAAGAAAVAAPSQCRRFHLLTLVPRRSSIPSHVQACPDGLCHTQGWSKWCSRRGLACCSAA